MATARKTEGVLPEKHQSDLGCAWASMSVKYLELLHVLHVLHLYNINTSLELFCYRSGLAEFGD